MISKILRLKRSKDLQNCLAVGSQFGSYFGSHFGSYFGSTRAKGFFGRLPLGLPVGTYLGFRLDGSIGRLPLGLPVGSGSYLVQTF